MDRETTEHQQVIEAAFQAFKEAWLRVTNRDELKRPPERPQPREKSQLKEAGDLLWRLIELSGYPPVEVARLCCSDRTSIHRWIKGENMPQPAQMKLLEQFFVPRNASATSFAKMLKVTRYLPVVSFMIQRENEGMPLSEQQLFELIELANRSKRILTPELIEAYLELNA